MTSRKRILFVHSAVANPNGPDISLHALMSKLDKTKFEPYLIVPAFYELVEKFVPLATAIEIIPRAIVVNVPKPFDIPTFLIDNAADANKISRILEKYQIDLVHNNIESCWLVGIVARQMGIPSVSHIRGLTSINTPMRRRIVPQGMQLAADKFVAVSGVVGDAFIDVGLPRSAMNVIDNGVDVTRFNPDIDNTYLRTKFNIPDDAPLIGAVGTADSRKGWLYLVMACALIREKFPNVKCVFTGDEGRLGNGTEKFNGVNRYIDVIQGMIQSLRLEDTIIFAGPQSDMPRIYASLDVLVQPSMIDAGPRAVIEGMATGLPIVATRVGGNADYVTGDHDGLLVPVADSTGLADAVCQILADTSLKQKLCSNARETAENRFALEIHVNRFETVYNALLE